MGIYTGIIDELNKLDRVLNGSPLIQRTISVLKSHPTTVSEQQLAAARSETATELLHAIQALPSVRHKGHPEEDTREIDNIDIQRLIDRFKANRQRVWAE